MYVEQRAGQGRSAGQAAFRTYREGFEEDQALNDPLHGVPSEVEGPDDVAAFAADGLGEAGRQVGAPGPRIRGGHEGRGQRQPLQRVHGVALWPASLTPPQSLCLWMDTPASHAKVSIRIIHRWTDDYLLCGPNTMSSLISSKLQTHAEFHMS